MVGEPTVSRKAQFRAACAYAGTTAKAWCEQRGITRGHLYAVLSGERESASLLADIDAFITEHVRPAPTSASA